MNITGRIRLRKANSEIFGITLFILSSLFSLYLALNLYNIPSIENESKGITIIFVLYYIIFIIIFTLIALYIIKKHANIMKGIFLILIIYMIFVVSSIISDIISVNLFEYYLIIALITGFFAYMLIFKNEWYITDAAGFIMIAGAASILGILLKTYIAIALLIVFAVYDYISVYKTKHMITLAKAAVNNEYPLLFLLPSNKNLKMKDLTFENRGESDIIMLGFGDMAIPELFIVSASIYNINHIILFASLTISGAIAALIFLFHFNKKPAPGLPYINTGVIIGFLIALLIIKI